VKPADGKTPYDRFRGRVMFPIFDQNGHVIAFSGRVFGAQKNQDGSDVAKYINSPEGLLYDKGSVMFGFDRAKRPMREQNFVILVEGQMDLIMAHQAGTENAVAVSGTALTERRLALLKRLTDNLVFAFDADDAGMNATARAFRLALGEGMNVRVAAIPDGKDPADYIKGHKDGWSKVIAESTHIIDYYLAELSRRGYDKRELESQIVEKVLPLVTSLESKIEEAHFIIEIARKLGVKEDAVWEDVKRVKLAERAAPQLARPVAAPSRSASLKTRRQVAEEEIVGILLWQEGHEEPAIDVLMHRKAYEERIAPHDLVPYVPEEGRRSELALRAEYRYEHGEGLTQVIDELLDTVEEEVLRERQAKLWQDLADAEARGEKDEAKRCLMAYQEITPRIIALEDRKLKRAPHADLDAKKK
jgi:DNA primase